MYCNIAALATRSCRSTYIKMNVTVSYIFKVPPGSSFNGKQGFRRTFSARSSVVSGAQTIRKGDVHLWWMPMKSSNSEGSYLSCKKLLDPVNEVGRLEKAVELGNQVEVDRLVARAYLRHVLSQYMGGALAPHDLSFSRNEYGKPEIKNHGKSGITFNLTHSQGIVGVAVSQGREIGLDVEAKERTTKKMDEMKLAERYFSKDEIEILTALPPGRSRQLLFVQLWTLKESYVKALGRGIGASPGLRSFGFQLCTINKAIEFLPSEKEPQYETPWSFTLLEPLPGYIGAVCSGPCANMSMYVSSPLTSCSSIHTMDHTSVPVPVLASSLM